MKWNSGQPVESGHYLCAIVGNSKPSELYWNGSSWEYLVQYDGWETLDGNEVAYYMSLNDIAMPEGWTEIVERI